LNGDGNPDIVLSADRYGKIAILLGNGDGTFLNGPQYTVESPAFFTLADLNRDGKLDIIVPRIFPASLAVFIGNGNGTFQPPQYIKTPKEPLSVVAADFNGDGIVDLAVSRQGQSIPVVIILRGLAGGSFALTSTIQLTTGASSPLVVGDLDGDGRLDIFAPSWGSIYRQHTLG
jgi:hypothetical protein